MTDTGSSFRATWSPRYPAARSCLDTCPNTGSSSRQNGPAGRSRGTGLGLFLGSAIRINEFASLVLRWPDEDPIFWIGQLAEVIAG